MPGIMTTFDRENLSQKSYTADNSIILADETRWPLADHASARSTYNETIFDGGSMRFNSPVAQPDFTDSTDKYIKFPRTNILE